MTTSFKSLLGLLAFAGTLSLAAPSHAQFEGDIDFGNGRDSFDRGDFDRGGRGGGGRDRDRGPGRDRDRDRDRSPSRAYAVIFCMDTNSPCRKWDSYGRGNPRSRSLEWVFSGDLRRDSVECRYVAQTFRGRKHGVTGKISAHMFSDGQYNPISSPRVLTGRVMDISDYCATLVRQTSR